METRIAALKAFAKTHRSEIVTGVVAVTATALAAVCYHTHATDKLISECNEDLFHMFKEKGGDFRGGPDGALFMYPVLVK